LPNTAFTAISGGIAGRQVRAWQRDGNEMLANNAEVPAESPPVARGKVRLLTLEAMDGRTVAARRARELARGFEAELGRTLSSTQRLAVERAAALVAIAEDAQARRLAGDPAVSLEDLVRVDNAAQRAVRQLGIKAPGVAAPAPLSPAAYLAGRAGASEASVASPEGNTHPEPPHEAGEASGGGVPE
jgi:hypothetical protein